MLKHTPINTLYDIDTFLGETLHENEQELMPAIVEESKKTVDRYYAKLGEAFRDAHAKTIGCVKATFHVNENLPPYLAKGVFIPGATYDALIRFSHFHEDPKADDRKRGIRGMAIKLKVPRSDGQVIDQDFVMVNHPVFFADDPADYLSLLKIQNSRNNLLIKGLRTVWVLGLRRAWILIVGMGLKKQITDPLMARYFSASAYRLGVFDDTERLAIKFSACPVSGGTPDQTTGFGFLQNFLRNRLCFEKEGGMPDNADANYLSKALSESLASGRSWMEFLVQPGTQNMSVENSHIKWDENISKFIWVGLIEIPQENPDEKNTKISCEPQAFDPWHGLPEHRPLGVVNRLRRVVYPAISAYRNELNAMVPIQTVQAVEQHAFTIVSKLKPDRLRFLKPYLEEIGYEVKHDREHKDIHFSKYERLHYCCFVLLYNDGKNEDSQSAFLVFEGNIDGPTEEFIRDMCNQDFKFLDFVYRNCDGWPSTNPKESLLSYLLSRDKGAHAFYVGHPGGTRIEITHEHDLHAEIRNFLDKERGDLAGQTPEHVRRRIQEHVANLIEDGSRWKWLKSVPAPSVYVKKGRLIQTILKNPMLFVKKAVAVVIGIAIFSIIGLLIADPQGRLLLTATGSLGLLVLGAVGLVFAYGKRLRKLENEDIQDERLRADKHWQDVQKEEDIHRQNHLTSVSYLKPGRFRLLTLRAMLFIGNFIARRVETQGSLSGIVTIHFARWVILDDGGIDNGKRLLFLSNYDGSWENYLGEFIDHASLGLTAIWSNTRLGKDRGFPKTKFLGLCGGGARDEQRFKAQVRNSQREEQIWYSAHRELSVKNITNNKAIREQLFRPLNDVEGWLRRF